MTVLNINNNVSEDYTYILDTQEIFYDKQSIPTDIYVYENNVWGELPEHCFDIIYPKIKQFILTHSPPKLLNPNEDFLSLIPTDSTTVSKKILLKDVTTDESIKYYVVLATVGAVDDIVDVEMQNSTDLTQQVILNENFTEEDYFAMTIENCSREVFSDIPKGEYELFLKTENEELLKYNQTIIIENNFPAKISLGGNTVTYTELQEESFVYIGISTDDQTNFPEIPKSQYFAIVFDENETMIYCIPIKSLRFANTKITDIQDYTPNDNEYLSARQTYNMIVKALEEFEIFQVFDSQQTFSQIQNPKANCIYFVYKPNESSDGLNMNFDLYSYDPDNNSFIKLDNLTFNPNNFAPKSHATSSTTYGIGTESNYGHTKIVNNLNQVSYIDGAALSAYQGYVLNQNKQNSLVSGTNIKTINSNSILSSGNLELQVPLVSGTNIKSINGSSILGSGNISVQTPLVSGTSIKTLNNTSLLGSGNINVQTPLVSGTSIKTINNQSLLGSGNIQVAANVDMSNYYTKTEIDTMIGDIQDYIYS